MGSIIIMLFVALFYWGWCNLHRDVKEIQKYYPDYCWYDYMFALGDKRNFENEELMAKIRHGEVRWFYIWIIGFLLVIILVVLHSFLTIEGQ